MDGFEIGVSASLGRRQPDVALAAHITYGSLGPERTLMRTQHMCVCVCLSVSVVNNIWFYALLGTVTLHFFVLIIPFRSHH